MREHEIFILIGQVLFAVFGACVRWINTKNKSNKKAAGFICEGLSAAFVGMLVYLYCSWSKIDPHIAFAIAGVLGHQGTKGIAFVSNIIITRAGLKEEEKEREKRKKKDD